MEKEKSNIKEELNHIKDSIKKNSKSISEDNDDYILLDKVVSNNEKAITSSYDNKEEKPKYELKEKSNDTTHNINRSHDKTNLVKKSSNNKPTIIQKKKKDPVAALVDREIKPIIKKWISKNLKTFVKTIVIEEMKLISKATQKHK